MTDELEIYGEGSYIKTFISGGPKFYAYQLCNGLREIFETCKVKGIRINYANSLKINFESVLKLIKQRDNKNTVNNIRLRNNMHEVVTCEETKTCSIV